MTDSDDTDLNVFFRAARQDPAARLPEDLAQAMIADARQARSESRAETRRAGPVVAAWPDPWARLRGFLGGWSGIGGLVTAGAVGLWLGLTPPQMLQDPLNLGTGEEAGLTLLPGDALELAMMEDL